MMKFTVKKYDDISFIHGKLKTKAQNRELRTNY
jgi:hypothetical protein